MLAKRAILAVTTMAFIILLSEYLLTHPSVTDMFVPFLEQSNAHLLVMIIAALSQWATLDGTFFALVIAAITLIGGPLAELPFVVNGIWEYLGQAFDYYALQNISHGGFFQSILGNKRIAEI